jgi:hypothetical protein
MGFFKEWEFEKMQKEYTWENKYFWTLLKGTRCKDITRFLGFKVWKGAKQILKIQLNRLL